MITYAIGDVHGRYDLFDAMLHSIFRRHAGSKVPGRVVTLGDYVDRGPDSRLVVERLMGLKAEARSHGMDAISLKGNHEQMMVAALHNPESPAGGDWALNGGLQALASYGGFDPDLVPQAHRDFLAGLPAIVVEPNVIFVHAGINGRRPLDAQSETELVWWRGSFDGPHRCSRLVVHGHTPRASAPSIMNNALNLDTGAYKSGVLSCGVVDDQGTLLDVFFATDTRKD